MEKLADLEFECRRLQALAEAGEDIGRAINAVTARRQVLELEMRTTGKLDATHSKLMMATRAPEGDYEVEFVGGRAKTKKVGAES